MKLDEVVAAVLLTSLLLLAATGFLPSVRGATGPRAEDLVIHFYSNVTEAYLGLKAGDVDLVLEGLPKDLATLARQDSNLVLAPVAEYDMYQFDLNNNWSIPSYPGIRSPMNYSQMRQAVAWLTDKNHVVDVICDGFAERIDQAIAAPLKGWANMSMWYPNYPYEYDPLAAKAVLDSTFPVGTTPNPYYDAGDPLSSQYVRHYPDDHPQRAGQDLNPLIFYVRSDDYARLMAGRMIYQALQKMGVPIDATEAPSAVTYTPVMGDFNYHFYTGGCRVGRFPSLTLYGLYHSDSIGMGGGNYVTGVRPGVPTHPKLDWLLEGGRLVDSYSEAVRCTKLAAGYMTEICVTVPLYSLRSYQCYSSKLLGVVNMEGQGLENDYTFMNAYKTDGSPIRCATLGPPHGMNIIYSGWTYDWQCLDRMNLFSSVEKAPYNPTLDMAGFTRDWEVTTWYDNAVEKTKLIMTFRSDGYFVKPVSGDQGPNVNATHYFASAWYYCQTSEWWGGSFFDLHHIDITDTYEFQVYFDTQSYWNLYYCQGPLLPIDTWAQHDELVTVKTLTFYNQTTPSTIYLEGSPIWIERVTFNGSPLTRFADYNIVNAGPGFYYGGRGVLSVNCSLGVGTMEVTYWDIGLSNKGYTPGNLPWQVSFEGAGMYYATDFVPGPGGYLALKRNPFYYMDTPLLGDIDFMRKSNGAFKVDIFDLALAGGAYSSQGVGYSSKHWFPGADVAPTGGVVDLYDLVTVTGASWDHEYDFPE